jgi:hypothetical protein
VKKRPLEDLGIDMGIILKLTCVNWIHLAQDIATSGELL